MMVRILDVRKIAECIFGAGSPDNDEDESEDPRACGMDMNLLHPRFGEG